MANRHDILLHEEIIQRVRQDNCFDFLRYLFAFSLIVAHFCVLTDTEPIWFISGTNRVKAFFTITGFLVTYSFLRRNCDIASYARKRFRRIIPAYMVCIIACLLLGMAVSSLGIVDFLANGQTWKYLVANISMLNWLEPELPMTFQDNLAPQMNGSLWSMKQEVLFYCLVPILMYIIGRTKRWTSLMMMAVCISVYYFMPVQVQYFVYFLSGMTLLLYFDLFMKHVRWLLPVSAVLFLFVGFFHVPVLSDVCFILEPVIFPMMLVGIAYCCKPLNVFRQFDNITYGLYLYHFPVIQCLILFGVVEYSKSLALILAFVITAIPACVSWFWIEKPLMNKK